MKSKLPRVLVLFLLAISSSINTQAQWYRSLRLQPLPLPSFDSFVNTPGVTINQILDTLTTLADATDTGEGGTLDQLASYKQFWQVRVGQNDNSGINMFDQYRLALRAAVIAGETSPCTGGGFQGSWQCIGPDSLPEQTVGRVNVVWADTGSDYNYILAGGEFGGLFKSTNGGKNWANITDNCPFVGGAMTMYHICVNPKNINTIYLGTAGAGILESFDRGNTWRQEFITSTGGYADSIENIQHIYITPDSVRLYAFKDDSIYTRSNIGTGNAWQNITPPGNTYNLTWCDLKFLPSDRTHFFVANQTPANGSYDKSYQGIWMSTDSMGSSWTKITTGLTDTLAGAIVHDTDWSFMKMSIPDAQNVYFLAYFGIYDPSIGTSVGYLSLFDYDLITNTTNRIKSSLPGSGLLQARGKGELTVSDAATDSNSNLRNIYFGWDLPYHSYDGGKSFVAIGGGTTHVDVRGMYLQQATNSLHGIGDRLLVANDGGVSEKYPGTDDSVSTVFSNVDISGKGLTCGEFNGFYISEAAGGMGLGGMMHDGVNAYEPQQNIPWVHITDGDAWTTTFNRANPNIGYAFNGSIYGSLAVG